jgi:AcrR family transcriptional regulator
VSDGAPDPARTTPKGDARREQIVDAAIVRLAQDGFEGFRIRDVATEAKVHHATLHHHFPTKNDLVRAVVGQFIHRFRNEIGGSVSDVSAMVILESHVHAILAQMVQQPTMFLVLNELFMRAHRDAEVAALLEPSQDEWAAQLAGSLGGRANAVIVERCVTLTMMTMQGMSFALGAKGALASPDAFQRLGVSDAKRIVGSLLTGLAALLSDER